VRKELRRVTSQNVEPKEIAKHLRESVIRTEAFTA
jgi:hypothetical protein